MDHMLIHGVVTPFFLLSKSQSHGTESLDLATGKYFDPESPLNYVNYIILELLTWSFSFSSLLNAYSNISSTQQTLS